MTNKTEMLSVPRELLERLLAVYSSSPWPAWHELTLALLAAPPKDVRAVADEPVATVASMLKHSIPMVINGVLQPSITSTDKVAMFAADVPAGTKLYRHPQRRLEMADVVKAHMEIPYCPVLTSNQCHALAMKLNACLDRIAELNK